MLAQILANKLDSILEKRLYLKYSRRIRKSVFLITDCVVDVLIDELVYRHKELGDKSIAVIEHIKDQKFILDTNEAFSEKFGWKEAEAKDFRLARTYGD